MRKAQALKSCLSWALLDRWLQCHTYRKTGLKVPSNIKFVPTANVLDYGEDLPLHLTTAGLSEKSITFSSAAITRSTEDSGQPLDAIPHVYSDTDTGLILHEGNDTTFNESYVFNSDMPAVIYKVSINVCMGLSVSAYSSGNFNLGNLIVTITSEGASTKIFTQTLLQAVQQQQQQQELLYIGLLLTLFNLSEYFQMNQ